MISALALLSSLLWGTADFFGGVASRRMRSLTVVGWSQAFGLVLVAVVELASGGPDGTRWLPWAITAGLVGMAGLTCFYAALASGTMGVVSPIAALGAIVPVLAGLLSGDRLTRWQVAGMVIGLIGAVTASGPELTGGMRGRSVMLAGIAGLAFGVAQLAIQRGSRSDPVATMLGMRVTSVATLLLLALVLRSLGGVRRAHLPILVITGVADVSANLLYGLSSARGTPSVVAVLGGLYPVATVLLGAVFLGERMMPVQRAGVGCAMIGIVLLAAG